MKTKQKTIEEIIQYNCNVTGKINPSSSLKKYWNFFPTPENLIKKMLENYQGSPLPKNILEPSAGKGDIIDYIRKFDNGTYRPNIYCYEIVPELQEILKAKGCQLLGDNFLKHKAKIDFDLIIMNPPFDRGANHVLHAWEILKRGGRVVALLNKHTYYNAYNAHRSKLKTIVDQFGEVEDLGQAFGNDVERTARVDVIMITLIKKANKYYQDLGINLNQYSNFAIKNCMAKYVIKEIAIN